MSGVCTPTRYAKVQRVHKRRPYLIRWPVACPKTKRKQAIWPLLQNVCFGLATLYIIRSCERIGEEHYFHNYKIL